MFTDWLSFWGNFFSFHASISNGHFIHPTYEPEHTERVLRLASGNQRKGAIQAALIGRRDSKKHLIYLWPSYKDKINKNSEQELIINTGRNYLMGDALTHWDTHLELKHLDNNNSGFTVLFKPGDSEMNMRSMAFVYWFLSTNMGGWP